MKRITAIALFAAASTLGIGSALAQDQAIQATMPFNFTVGSKLLPAGTYSIIRVQDDFIEIKDANKDTAVLSPSSPDDNQSKNGLVLVFNKYGGEYFLREVLGGSAGAMNVNVPLTASEERVRKQKTLALNLSQVSIPASEGN